METRFGNCLVGQLGGEQRSNYRFGMYHVNKLSISYNDYEESVLRDHLQAELAGIDRYKIENRRIENNRGKFVIF